MARNGAWARRDWRERDVRVVLAALVIAVATVATIALFADQLQRTLVSSASAFLAADRQLEAENGRPIPDEWLQQARARGWPPAGWLSFPPWCLAATAFSWCR